MLVLFSEGVLKDVSSVEVQPLDFGDGKIIGTQINFVLTNGDELKYIYSQSISEIDVIKLSFPQEMA